MAGLKRFCKHRQFIARKSYKPIYFKRANKKISERMQWKDIKSSYFYLLDLVVDIEFLVQPTSVRNQGSKCSLLSFREMSNNGEHLIKMPIKFLSILIPKSKN